MRITVEYPPESMAAIERLRALPRAIPRILMRTIDLQNEFTVGHIQRTRLSQRGPTTLGVITNRLRSSIRPSKAVQEGTDIVSAIGSNVEYAGIHEYGFDGNVTVRAHSRLGKPVRSHSRHMRMRARAPIRIGLTERLGAYAEAMAKAVVEAATRGGTP